MFTDKIRFLLNNISFLKKFRSDMYKRILGHDKIIAYEKGNPVYSLTFPAFLGNQYRHAMITQLLTVIQNRRVPMIASLDITDKCDSNCEQCYFRKKGNKGEVLKKDELIKVMNDCADMGLNTLLLLGGEPLLNPDVFELAARFPHDKTNLVLFTNGSRLKEQAGDLKKAGLNKIYVSLLYSEESRHDGFAKHPGLFAKAMAGIEEAQKHGILTGISYTIHDDTPIEDYRELFKLAGRMNICEIYVNTEIENKTLCNVFDGDKDVFYKESARVNSDKKFRTAVLYYPHFISRLSFGCAAGSTRFHIDAYGDVSPCEVIFKSFGNIRQKPIHSIWFDMSNSSEYRIIGNDCRAKGR